MTVRELLENAGFDVDSVSLGKAEIQEEPDRDQFHEIDQKLREKGFELIKQNSEVLTGEIKAHLIDYLNYIEDEDQPEKLSEYLSKQLHHNYSYLSSHFSDQENLTIERYFIHLKIERVKELLTYEEMTLSEIAWKLDYSSVQYLSNQFKKVTGETVSTFRKHMDAGDRQSLDTI
jgi:YesN/AraC family two-component response regulator